MKLDNMFKKTRRPSGKKGHIGGKHQSPEVPEGLLCKCNKCQKAIITEDVITGDIFARMSWVFSYAGTGADSINCR